MHPPQGHLLTAGQRLHQREPVKCAGVIGEAVRRVGIAGGDVLEGDMWFQRRHQGVQAL